MEEGGFDWRRVGVGHFASLQEKFAAYWCDSMGVVGFLRVGSYTFIFRDHEFIYL